MVSAGLSEGETKAAPAISQPTGSTGSLHLQTVQDAVFARRQSEENARTIRALRDSLALMRRDQEALLRRLEAVEVLVQEGVLRERMEPDIPMGGNR